LTIWHCNLSTELAKTHSFRLFFGDFAHWDSIIIHNNKQILVNDNKVKKI